MKKIIFLFGLFILCVTVGSAQKYGHLNFGNLVSLLPETDAADSELEAYRDQLVAKGETMAQNFQEKYADFVQKVQSGDLPPVQQQELQAELQEKQQEIVAYEQEISQKVQQKRQELLEPIIEKAETAIGDIAKENGYTFIFDTSIYNAVLFAKESEDVMPLVKTKLGLE